MRLRLLTAAVIALLATGAWAQNLNGCWCHLSLTRSIPAGSASTQQQHPSVHINYQSVGSGAGIRQVSEKTVDFGASDGPMTDQQLAEASQVA